MSENKEVKFEELYKLNINEKTDKRDNGQTKLTYISWSCAWAEFKKLCPNVKYEVKMFNGLPYVYDDKTGYMVFTSVTVGETTHDMWLPVMDGNNKAMKSEAYKYVTKKGFERTVQPATMFDINKSIMRCLVKNLAMFGFGLYLYNGEDLPEGDNEENEESKMIKAETIEQIKKLNIDEKGLCAYYKVDKIEELTEEQGQKAISLKTKANNKNKKEVQNG